MEARGQREKQRDTEREGLRRGGKKPNARRQRFEISGFLSLAATTTTLLEENGDYVLGVSSLCLRLEEEEEYEEDGDGEKKEKLSCS